MRIDLPLSLLAVLAMAALAAGCGGDEGPGDAAAGSNGNSNGDATGSAEAGTEGSETPQPIETSQLSKAQYRKRANAICARHREQRYEQLDPYREEYPVSEEQDEYFAAVLEEVYVPTMGEMISELRELGAPKGERKKVEAIIAGFEKWVSTAEGLEGEQPPPEFLNEVGRAGERAGNYGLVECTYG